MTTSYQEVQYGEYASGGPDSPSEIADPVCRRIHIRTGPRYRHSGAPGIQLPAWSPRQVSRLTTVSPALQARIDRLKVNGDGGSVWLIESRSDDGIFADTASHVLNMIAVDQPETNAIEDEASVLSRYCSILWFFEVIPRNFRTCALWDSSDTRRAIGALDAAPPLHPVATNGTDYGHTPVGAIAHVRWCWSRPRCRTTYETALHIANFALILDRKDVFRNAIKQVVWETRPVDAVLLTPVKYLKQAGPDGINKNRKQEMEQVLAYLTRYLTNARKTDSKKVDRTIKILSENGIEIGDEPDGFDPPSVFELLRRIEAIFLPPPPPPPAALPPTVPPPGRRAHSRQPTHGSSKTNSSSGSHHSALGESGGPTRQDSAMTTMTAGTSHTHKSSASKRHGGGGGGSSSSHPSSPPSSRPNGPSLTDAMEKLHKKLSSPRREPKTGPVPVSAPGPRAGPPELAEFVRDMLQNTHNFILDRQAIVAEDMLARRDLDVAGWEERLLP